LIYYDGHRGEGMKGYSSHFRQLEFSNAYNAVLMQKTKYYERNHELCISFNFDDATQCTNEMDDLYGATQIIRMGSIEGSDTTTKMCIDEDTLVKASERCSLIRNVYQIVGQGSTYEELATSTDKNDYLRDLMCKQISWSLRYTIKKMGVRDRLSSSNEKYALTSMWETLFRKFMGPVDLKHPDCPLFIFRGLQYNNEEFDSTKLILAKCILAGPKTSIIQPNSRKCITRTPLCPIAAFLLCNLARVKDNDRVLDPFAGSCTTLLAASMMAANVKTVGVDIAIGRNINQEQIMLDFMARGLKYPELILQGDITDEITRDLVREAVGFNSKVDGVFDIIIADPPYGIREAMGDSESTPNDVRKSPLIRLVECMGKDKLFGKSLLRIGGRMAVFAPTMDDEDVNDTIPNTDLLYNAGLEFVEMKEQPLSKSLSRWLVIYRCIK
jgi:tRNA G10  N-methylase Trm11